ncbi:MAG: hypothetical protein RL555_755 [Bacteroidota bacterium]|jgi:hypothetical protein|nr:DUF4199 family protein [Bacteroidota bacterium]GDX41742.1 hypothetical protein LBMAG22_02710 [Bacteroidota bacterium]
MNLKRLTWSFTTAFLMMAISWLGFLNDIPNPTTAQLLVYGFYALSTWFLLFFNRSESQAFKDFFQIGFRHFILVTLLMALFSYIFIQLHPNLIEDSAKQLRLAIQASNNRTPAEIERDVKLFIEGYPTAMVSRTIFGYLVVGSLVTAISSFLLTLQKK